MGRARLEIGSEHTLKKEKIRRREREGARLEIGDEHRFSFSFFFSFFSRRREQNGQGFGHLQLYRSVEVGRQPSTSKPPLCRWHSGKGGRGKLNSIPFPRCSTASTPTDSVFSTSHSYRNLRFSDRVGALGPRQGQMCSNSDLNRVI